jgi:hypothetical protein
MSAVFEALLKIAARGWIRQLRFESGRHDPKMVILKTAPLVCILTAVGWYALFEWLRCCLWKKHKDARFVLSLTASFGAFAFVVLGCVLLALEIFRRSQ